MLSQSTLESQKFVNLVSRKNLGLVVFTDVVSGCLDSSSAFHVDDNLSEALRALSADGVSTVFISGGNHERFSRFSECLVLYRSLITDCHYRIKPASMCLSRLSPIRK